MEFVLYIVSLIIGIAIFCKFSYPKYDGLTEKEAYKRRNRSLIALLISSVLIAFGVFSMGYFFIISKFGGSFLTQFDTVLMGCLVLMVVALGLHASDFSFKTKDNKTDILYRIFVLGLSICLAILCIIYALNKVEELTERDEALKSMSMSNSATVTSNYD